MSEDTDLIDSLWKRTQAQFSSAELYITKSVPTFLEATNPKANKGQAVQFMAETLLGITATEVMTVGDSYNDVEMLAYAGMGVAMGNAEAAVQATANWVAPTVTADGVAAAIEEFILIGLSSDRVVGTEDETVLGSQKNLPEEFKYRAISGF